MSEQKKRFGCAVVMGGSMAGLLNARALADVFERVIVLERDVPEGAAPRKGVPQGRHVHVLLSSGLRVMNEFFPGLTQELLQDGASLIDSARDLAWFHFGVWRSRFTSGIEVVVSTRPLLEAHLRRRLTALPNVELRYGESVLGLLTDEARTRVTGVRLEASGGGEAQLLADLVVDATGRGSRTPQWLTQLGYQAPEEEQIGVELTYTSALFTPPPGREFPWKFLVVYPRVPESWRGGFILPVERNQWMVTLNGYFGDHAPTDLEGFLAYARTLPRPDVAEALEGAAPSTPISSFKIPTNWRRRYDRLDRFPGQYLVVGDAVAAFNPIFGQGMSVSSLGAELLRECAAEATTVDELATRTRTRLPEVQWLPWLLGAALDLHYPQTKGDRAPAQGALSWYLSRFLESTSENVRATQALYEVLHLRQGLGALASPSVALPSLAYCVKSLFTPLERRGNVVRMPEPLPLSFGEAR